MNRSKRLFLLLGVLAAACLITFGVSRYQEHQEQIKTSSQILLEIPEDSVTALAWDCDGQSLSFTRDGGGWVYDGDAAFPVNPQAISALLEGFQAFGVCFVIEDVEDYGQYGLDDPQCTIRLTTEQTEYEIRLGDYSAIDAQRYVSIGDGRVYLAAEDPMDAFSVELSQLMANDSLPYVETAEQISIRGQDPLEITWQAESTSYRADDHYFAQTEGGSVPLDTSLVEELLYTLGSLELTDYMTYTAGAEDLAAYGLDDPERTILLTYTAEDEADGETTQTAALAVSRAPAERWADSQADAGAETDEEEITAYARVGQSSIIYRITAQEYEALMAAGCDTLRHRELLPAALEDVSQVDVTLDGTAYTFTSDGAEDSPVWFYQEQALEDSALSDALQALSADSFTDQSPDGGEELSLTFHLDLEGSPTVTVTLYRYDGASCLAAVDGVPTALVSRSQVVELQEAVYAEVLGERQALSEN